MTVFVGDAEKPVIDSDEHAELLRAVKEGKFQFNGEEMRISSLSVRRP